VFFQMQQELPIYQIRKDIQRVLLSSNQLILHAPTGSGKSTLVPQFLMDDVLNPLQTVIVLQPRRIAARLLATFIAQDRNTLLGNEVGYQVRLEGMQSASTRILFITEGILLNQLLRNSLLSNVGAIIFDEFHERHLETDLSLSLALQLQQNFRPDLKLVVMSATMEIEKVKKFLPQSLVLETTGRIYPVTIQYYKPKPYEPIWEFAALQLEKALTYFTEGSALVFMPGAFEIRKTIDAIQKRSNLQQFQICPLCSSLPKSEQDKALSSEGRKIIVTTNIAETSVTLPGIRLVIDSGLAKIARFDSRRGINTLFTEPISRMSADQRAGRAGRIAPGICIRLWGDFDHAHRIESNQPEIHRIDLSEAILGIIASGTIQLSSFPWIDPPAALAVEKSLSLLKLLGALDKDGNITQTGKYMASLNVHPRFGRMLVQADRLNCLAEASVLVAISQSNGFISGSNNPAVAQERIDLFGHSGSDLLFDLNAWLWAGNSNFKQTECSRLGINAHNARQIGQLAIQILHKASSFSKDNHKLPQQRISAEEEINLRKCILTGFVDCLAVRHKMNSPTCQMMYGRSGQLHPESTVQQAKLMVVNELEETKAPNGVKLSFRKVTEVDPDWLAEIGINEYKKVISYRFDLDTKRAVQQTEYCIQDLVLERQFADIPDHDKASEIITEAILDGKIDFPQWNEDVEYFVRRVNFASKHAPHYEIPAIDNEAKEFIIQQAVYRCRSAKDVLKANVWPVLKAWLSYEQYEAVNYIAPEFFELPHRKKPVKLRYDDKGEVILSETIQALYDCPLPITVAEGKVQVVFELLAPSRRPVQITRDLEYFWKNSYLEIRKELKGRYPKHEWR